MEELPELDLSAPVAVPDWDFRIPAAFQGERAPRLAVYKGWQEPMEAGWTRWVLDRHGIAYDTLHDADVRAGGLHRTYDVLLLQSQRAPSRRNTPVGSAMRGCWPSGTSW